MCLLVFDFRKEMYTISFYTLEVKVPTSLKLCIYKCVYMYLYIYVYVMCK